MPPAQADDAQLSTQDAERAPDLRGSGERIDALLSASASGGIVARERAEELIRLVTDLYGAGLERLMDILYQTGHLQEELLTALAHDELVSSLLLVHGLHPYSVETRVEEALESVRPYLGTHGGDVELLGVTPEGTVRIRMLGSCDGCPSSSVTLKLAVEDAIETAAPEISGIEVDTSTSAKSTQSPLISADSLLSRLEPPMGGDGASWHAVSGLADLAAGAVTTAKAGQTQVLVCRIGSDLFAFGDRCPGCESSLAGASMARRLGGAIGDAVLRCPVCQVHYDVRAAGASPDAPELHLDPLPLLVKGDVVTVAVPTPVSA